MALLLPHFNFPQNINTNDRITGYAQGVSIIHMSVAGFTHIYAGMVWDHEVGGSNPPTPTIDSKIDSC